VSAGGAVLSAARLRELLGSWNARLHGALHRLGRAASPRPVHQARVAARSLRSLLCTLGPLLRPDLLARARRDLRNIAIELEEVREADVRRERLTALAERRRALTPGAQRQLVLALERDQEAARRRFLGHARSAGFRERAERLIATLGDPRLVVARGDVAQITLRRLRKRWKRLRKALRSGHADPEALHELRLAVKHARYASEALMPLLGIDPQPYEQQLKRMQDCLGEHHDAIDALEWLEGLGEPVGPILAAPLRPEIRRVLRRCERQLDRLAARLEVPAWPT
jgi:CHAD domain-containing protein